MAESLVPDAGELLKEFFDSMVNSASGSYSILGSKADMGSLSNLLDVKLD
jgi:hypothetical protein